MNGKYEGRDYRVIEGMDPAANWLLDVAIEDYLPDGPDTPIPFLFELTGARRNAMVRILLRMFDASERYDELISRVAEDAPIQLPLVHTLAFFEELRTSDALETEELRTYVHKRILLSSPFIPAEVSVPASSTGQGPDDA
jgi:hypothetical protein